MYLVHSHGFCLWTETKWKSADGDWLTANQHSSFEYAISLYIRKALLILEGGKEQYMANPLSVHQALIWDHYFVLTVERWSSKNHFKTLYTAFSGELEFLVSLTADCTFVALFDDRVKGKKNELSRITFPIKWLFGFTRTLARTSIVAFK